MQTRPTKLTKLQIDEISVVDVPANPMAAVTVCKRSNLAAPTWVAKVWPPTAPAEFAAPTKSSQQEIANMQTEKSEAPSAKLLRLENEHMAEHGVDRPAAVDHLSRHSPAYRQAYAGAVNAADLASARVSTLLANADRDSALKNGPAVSLEKMAADFAAAHKVSVAAGYSEVLKSADGKRLYRESLARSAA